MATKVINFYKDFVCLATECPNTCCRGWHISIDDDTVERYREEQGAEGFRLKAMMSFGENKEVRRVLGRCTNETKEGLCRLQRKGRTDLMPEVCRVFPRRGVLIGEDMEVTFELSCPLSARLFLENASDLHLVTYEGEDTIPVWIQDKFDKEYYDDILKIRDKVTDYVNCGDYTLPRIMNNLYEYFRNLHKSVLAEEKDITKIPIEDKDKDKGIASSELTYNFYSFAMFDKILMNDLDDGRFKLENPLYKFTTKYNKVFGKMTAAEADVFFHQTVTKIIEEYPFFSEKYKGYLTYFLIQTLYSSYETVTFYREYLLGMVYLMALITTDVVDYVNGRDMLSTDRQVENINACERRFRHNVTVRKNVTKRIGEEFTKKKEGYIF